MNSEKNGMTTFFQIDLIFWLIIDLYQNWVNIMHSEKNRHGNIFSIFW